MKWFYKKQSIWAKISKVLSASWHKAFCCSVPPPPQTQFLGGPKKFLGATRRFCPPNINYRFPPLSGTPVRLRSQHLLQSGISATDVMGFTCVAVNMNLVFSYRLSKNSSKTFRKIFYSKFYILIAANRILAVALMRIKCRTNLQSWQFRGFPTQPMPSQSIDSFS